MNGLAVQERDECIGDPVSWGSGAVQETENQQGTEVKDERERKMANFVYGAHGTSLSSRSQKSPGLLYRWAKTKAPALVGPRAILFPFQSAVETMRRSMPSPGSPGNSENSPSTYAGNAKSSVAPMADWCHWELPSDNKSPTLILSR